MESFDTDFSTDPEAQVQVVQKPHQYPAKVGNMYCFLWNKKSGLPRVVIGPHWFFFAVILVLAIAFSAINLGMCYQII